MEYNFLSFSLCFGGSEEPQVPQEPPIENGWPRHWLNWVKPKWLQSWRRCVNSISLNGVSWSKLHLVSGVGLNIFDHLHLHINKLKNSTFANYSTYTVLYCTQVTLPIARHLIQHASSALIMANSILHTPWQCHWFLTSDSAFVLLVLAAPGFAEPPLILFYGQPGGQYGCEQISRQS